ncbi:MAG: hypothetical protein ACOCWM_04855 [Cyclobacteriaceae bacterium]
MKNINNSTKEKKKANHKKRWKKPSLLVLNKSCTEGGVDNAPYEGVLYYS